MGYYRRSSALLATANWADPATDDAKESVRAVRPPALECSQFKRRAPRLAGDRNGTMMCSTGRLSRACPGRSIRILLGSLCGALSMLLVGCRGLPDHRAPVLDHTLAMSVGGQLLDNYRTGVRFASGSGSIGTDIDAEDDLGFDSSSEVLRLDIDWRIANRHGLSLSYFDVSRRTSRQIDTEIRFGDVVFPINTEVSARFAFSVIKLAYRYLLVARERWDLGLSLGIHALDLSFGLEATGIGQADEANALAPFPVLGLYGAYALNDKTRLALVGEVFAIEVDDSSGRLLDARLNLDYDVGDHWGVGIGYNAFDLDVDLEESGFAGSLGWRYDGVLIYVRGLF